MSEGCVGTRMFATATIMNGYLSRLGPLHGSTELEMWAFY